MCWAKTHQLHREKGPAKHASFNEPVTEAGLSSMNTEGMNMRTQTHTHWRTHLYASTETNQAHSWCHAHMLYYTRTHKSIHGHTQTCSKQKQPLPPKTFLYARFIFCWGAHPSAEWPDTVTWIQHNSWVNISSLLWGHLLLRTLRAASFAQCLLSGSITAQMNRLLVIFL